MTNHDCSCSSNKQINENVDRLVKSLSDSTETNINFINRIEQLEKRIKSMEDWRLDMGGF